MLYKKIIFLIVFFINACGFKPLYRYQEGDSGIYPDLAKIYISPIEGRVGQLVRNNLKDRINIYGSPEKPQYILGIDIKDPVIQQSTSLINTANRETIVYKAMYRLVENGETIIDGMSKAEASYSILTMPYATVVSKEDAIKRVAAILADDIILRLSVYFKNINQSQNNSYLNYIK